MEKSTFLFEEDNEEDGFKVHTSIAKVLKNKIIKMEDEEITVNIGLLGKWGSGKSFIVNKLEKDLNNEPIKVLKFDGWKFNGKSLERSILLEIDKQAFWKKESNGNDEITYKYKGETLDQILNCRVKINTSVEPSKKVLKKKFYQLYLILAIMTAVGIAYNYMHVMIESWIVDNISKQIFDAVIWIGSIFGVAKVLAGIFDESFKFVWNALVFRKQDAEQQRLPAFSSEQFEDIFKDMINKIIDGKDTTGQEYKKVLIIFDNIDRCDPHYAYEIITTIKTYMGLEKCVYIIPCDDYALKKFLFSKNFEGNEEDFLDKFFNVTIRIPNPTVENLDLFIEKCLNKLGLENIDSKNIIRQVLYFACKGESPRQVKRFLNDFSMYYSLAIELDEKKEYHLKNIENFSVIVAIKQKWPEFEQFLLENINFRRDYYSGNKSCISLVKSYSSELVEFLNKVSDYFNNSEDLYSYIYFLHQDDSEVIRRQIESGSELEIDSYNSKVFENEINQIINSNVDYIKSKFILQSLFKTIKKEYSIKRDTENLRKKFNSYIIKIFQGTSFIPADDFFHQLNLQESIFFSEIFKVNTIEKERIFTKLKDKLCLKFKESDDNVLLENLEVFIKSTLCDNTILVKYLEECILRKKIQDFFRIIQREKNNNEFIIRDLNIKCLDNIDNDYDLILLGGKMDQMAMIETFEKYVEELQLIDNMDEYQRHVEEMRKANDIKITGKIIQNMIFLLDYVLEHNEDEKVKENARVVREDLSYWQRDMEKVPV